MSGLAVLVLPLVLFPARVSAEANCGSARVSVIDIAFCEEREAPVTQAPMPRGYGLTTPNLPAPEITFDWGSRDIEGQEDKMEFFLKAGSVGFYLSQSVQVTSSAPDCQGLTKLPADCPNPSAAQCCCAYEGVKAHELTHVADNSEIFRSSPKELVEALQKVASGQVDGKHFATEDRPVVLNKNPEEVAAYQRELARKVAEAARDHHGRLTWAMDERKTARDSGAGYAQSFGVCPQSIWDHYGIHQFE